MLQGESALFKLLRQEYETTINLTLSDRDNLSMENVPYGFPSEYCGWLADDKSKYASKQVDKKVKHLAYLIYPSMTDQERADKFKEIHTQAKLKNGISPKDSFIGYKGWEKIYLWLFDRITEAQKLRGMGDL